MTPEEIKKKAEGYYPKCESPSLIVTLNEDDIIEREQQAFAAGAEWMRGEMEKFDVWRWENEWYYDKNERKWFKTYDVGNSAMTTETKTYSELYQIYKQQKP